MGETQPCWCGVLLNGVRHSLGLRKLQTMEGTQALDVGETGRLCVLPVWHSGSETGGVDGRSPLPGTLAQPQPLCCSPGRSLKASEAPEQDEDEGFSDWSQKPEQKPRHSTAEEPPEGESTEGDQEEDRQVGSSLEKGLPGGGSLQAPQPGPEQ